MNESENLNRWPSRFFVLVHGLILGLLLFTNSNFGLSMRSFSWIATASYRIGIFGILAWTFTLLNFATPIPLSSVT